MMRKIILKGIIIATGGSLLALKALACSNKASSVYNDAPEEKNPMEGKRVIFVEDDKEAENADGARGHLESVGEAQDKHGIYQKYVKRGIDVALSFAGMVVLSPVIGGIALAIKIDDPGPVLFTQKRIGKNKQYFKLHKFRSMKMSTPHDVPTHMLDNPEQYITSVGKFLREHSLDELPQIWDIFIGNMSVIGPRPALWNQDVLTAERDKYGANEVKPGLTGWAQINGRDELELPEKARLDGEYAEQINKGGFKALMFDCKCFVKTFLSVAKSDGVVEGGTGSMQDSLRNGVPKEDPHTPFGCDMELLVDKDSEKHILITGKGSYIGESVKTYAAENYPNLKIDTIDMIDGTWRKADFSKYDCVYHVAGIAHADVGKVSDVIKEKYYAVNTDLAIETAKKAKAEGVKQFIFMSSMIIYGESAPYGKEKVIDRYTEPHPDNFYGDSKWQADKGVRALADERFKVAVLRPPMIYGKGSKGNYLTLSKIAKKIPLFPNVNNERSMLFIDNLCEFLCNLFMAGEEGVYFPQNSEYSSTGNIVKYIKKATDRKPMLVNNMSLFVKMLSVMQGRVGKIVNKAFGSIAYDRELSNYSFEYSFIPLEESIFRTEDQNEKNLHSELF